MSEFADFQQSADSASRKRCTTDKEESSTIPNKNTKLNTTSNDTPSTSQSCRNGEGETQETAAKTNDSNGGERVGESSVGQTDQTHGKTGSACAVPINNTDKSDPPDASGIDKPQSSDEQASLDRRIDDRKDARGQDLPSTSLDQSDSAAIAAAEALASLTRGDSEDNKETPCSSERAGKGGKVKHGDHESSKETLRTQAAAADSSTSVRSVDKEDADAMPDGDEGDDSIPGSSSTPSSSFPSDNEDDEDGECAIVSVKMAPEIRQSVALLAQVQMRLEALEKKSARLHQRVDLKIGRLRRPHLDQRCSITKSIPGFWVTALLNHPHLSAHIDETDEDALSYMIDLEIESFKNNKLGYRIRFHFRRNPYFQNSTIMKELHLGMGGSPVSFSNPILWHRGQNLTAHSEPRKTTRGVYQTFFSWFSDHSNPGRDDIAQILKDDLYRDPLRYYLTPLWEPRENGSGASGARAADNSNGDDCVVISDSDDDQEEEDRAGQGHSKEDDDEEDEEEEEEDEEEEEEEEEKRRQDESPEEEDGEIVIDGSDSDQEAREEDEDEESFDKDEVYVDEDAESSRDLKAKDQDDDEEDDIDIDEEERKD